MLGIEPEHLLPHLGRHLRRGRALGVEGPELVEERDRILVLRGVGDQRLALAMQDLRERQPPLLALVQRGERDQRLRVGLPRRVREDPVVDLDREPAIAQPLRREPRHLAELRAPLVLRQHAGLAAQHIDQRAPLAPLRIDLFEARERIRALDGRRCDLDDPLERPDRVREVPEALRPQVRDFAQERHALAVAEVRHLALACQHRDQIVPAAEDAELPRELGVRALVLGIELQDRVEGVDHHHVELQAIAIDLDDLVQLLDPRRHVALGDALQLVLHQIQQRVPLLRAPVQAPECRSRLSRLARPRIRAEHLLPRFDRLLGIVLRLRELGDLDAHRVRRRGRRATHLPEQREELGVLAAGRIVRAIDIERRRVRGLELAHAPEHLLRLIEIADVLPQRHRDLKQDPEVVAVAARLQRGLIRRDERGPVLRRRVALRHLAQRARLGRIELQRALDRDGRAGGTVGTQVLAADLREQQQGRDLLVDGRRELGPLLEQGRELAPPRAAPEVPHEMERCLAVARLDLEGLAQVRLGLDGVRRIPAVGLGGRQEQARREAAIRRRGRLRDVLRGELLPVRRPEIEILDRLGDECVVGCQRLQRHERRAGARDIE